jgi:threonine dehydrogenase-like Zn-dependent dehydrogenase
MTLLPDAPTKFDPSSKYLALCWNGKKDIRAEKLPKPRVTDPTDALVKITTTAICGSDLHMYDGWFPGMKKGDVLGHEFMGYVEEVGSQVKSVKVGDRVVVSCLIFCGKCRYCKNQEYSLCDKTNDSKAMEHLYGRNICGVFGYSHLTGGYPGGQAEYARVPYADNLCLKIGDEFRDEKVLFMSDILCTAWHGTELGRVGKGDTVAIWGQGPVGLLTAKLCQIRGASRVIVIDAVDYRLEFAKQKIPGVEIIDYSKEQDVPARLLDMTGDGPDVGIECAGFHYTKSWTHSALAKLNMETDSADILNEMIKAIRKGGHMAVIGDYVGFTNAFNVGGLMEKAIIFQGGQNYGRKYWSTLLDLIKRGEIDPSFIITHRLPLEKGPEAYKMFDEKKDGCIKVVLKPPATRGEI